MKTTLKDIHTIVASLAIVVLGLLAVPECGAQTPNPYIPPPYAVNISPQTNGATVSVAVSVDLPDTCHSVGNWSQPLLLGNSVYVDAQFWRMPLICLPVIITVSTQYNLGTLPPGNYSFVFRAWGTTVKTQAFSVPVPDPPRLSIRVSQVELCWDTAINAWYQLQYRSTLTTNQWLPLTLWFPGSGNQFCTNDAILAGQAQRFYQVARTNAPPP
jgi:hypothetical protein